MSIKTMEQLVQQLDDKIPRDVIEQRDGGGRKLDYLPGWYVIDRLNQVFGHGRWSFSAEPQKLYEGEVEQRSGKSFYVSYMARTTLRVKYPDGEICDFTDVGFGDGTDKTNPGKAHELAMKEAATDGLKRCARLTGNSMGNGLYDKSGDGVSEASDKQDEPAKAPAATPAKKDRNYPALITANATVLDKQGKMTKAEVVAEMKKKYGVEKSADLKPADAAEFLTFLENKAKGAA